jgi:hypothetical protein
VRCYRCSILLGSEFPAIPGGKVDAEGDTPSQTIVPLCEPCLTALCNEKERDDRPN